MVARTPVNVPIRVMNPSYHERIINKETKLACCETVKSVHTPEANQSEQPAGDVKNAQTDEKLPLQLKELV